MFKPANRFACLGLLLLMLSSCHQSGMQETDEAAFWSAKLIDSSYRLLYKDKDTTSALAYFDSAFKQTGQSSLYPMAARFRLLANYYYFFTPNDTATAKMIDTALAIFTTPDQQNHYPRTYVGLLLFGGQIAYRLSEYSKANGYYFRAKKLADAHLSPCERTAFNYSIAMVLFRQQNFTESLNYFKQAYALQETCYPQATQVVLQQQEIQGNIGECFVRLNQYDSAMIHFDKALAITDQYKDSLGPITVEKIYGVIYGDKAKVALEENHLKEAEQLSLKSIALNDRQGYEVENAMRVKLQLADAYGRQKDFRNMTEVLKVLGGVIKTADAGLQVEWRRLMASYYEQTAQADSALPFLKSYFSLRDSIAEKQHELTAADVARQFREKEQDGQIAVLKNDQRMTQILLWVAIVFSGMTLSIIYLVSQNYLRSKKSLAVSLALNEEIKRQKAAREEEAKERHKQITEAVIRAQESERSLIGLELHDNVGQVLTTVKLHNEMLLEGVGDPKTLLPRTLKYLQDCINEIRSLSKRLSAPTLGKISLEESVKDLIDSINLTSKAKITQVVSGLESGTLKQDVHIGVYRILQEQLNNVVKHAEASEVLVQLERSDNYIRLSITDNGKGFSVDSNKSGIGLINMQTRAENLNGSFEVNTKPGEGCRVEIVVPCLQ